jgi:hypothetical protein
LELKRTREELRSGKVLRSEFKKRLIAVLSWEEWLYERTALRL